MNARFGHKTRDYFLIEFANLLRKTFSKQAIISRLGGDKFIVLMKNIDECTM
ncbi:MAG: diguanylate cyclase [Candidatus Niameybacter stercoravium]|nr:diguanylate cyclase [Candidatus Niameybacter stercoravium]